MNKFFNIAIAAVVSAFIATNFYLLFSDKSVITKSVYVNEYERMTVGDFIKEKPKEALVIPSETYTVYVREDETIASWLVTEGDPVFIGEELALLNTEQADRNRAIIEAEYDGLMEQKNELENLLDELLIDKSLVSSDTYPNVNHYESFDSETGEKIIGLDMNFAIDVSQEGTYSDAIASAERQLADVARQLVVVEAQLAQDPSSPALISPIDGVVSNVIRTGSTIAVEVYSSQKEVITYAKDDEWQEVETGDRVLLQGEGIEVGEEGTVLSVSTIHAKENDWLTTYKTLDKEEAINPLAYYEVRIQQDSELPIVPYSHNVNANIILDEALSVVSLNEKWLRRKNEQSAQGTILTEQGQARVVEIETSFTQRNRAIVSSGLQPGDVAIRNLNIGELEYEPIAYLRMPSYMPTKKEWKSFGWKNYLRHMVIK